MRGIRNRFLNKAIWWGILRVIRVVSIFRKKKQSSHILMFHDIGMDDPENFSVSPKRFIEIIEWHKDNGYTFKSIGMIKEGCSSKKECFVTFDDGKVNFLSVYPYLKKEEIPFCIYIISSKIGKNGYLSVDEIKKLSSDNLCTIGSHTKSHSETRYLDESTLLDELVESKSVIERVISRNVDHFAFPHGDLISTSLFDEYYVKEAGYKTAAKTTQVPLGKYTRSYSLPRYDASRANILEVL